MTLTEADILDVPDALCDDDSEWPECQVCGEPARSLDTYGWCRDCRDHEDPSPMCNCGECTPGNYTCIRKD